MWGSILGDLKNTQHSFIAIILKSSIDQKLFVFDWTIGKKEKSFEATTEKTVDMNI